MTQSDNIEPFERVGRIIFGSAILIGILQFALPSGLAFIAAFIILTAIIAWDPFYALCSLATKILVPFARHLLPTQS